MKQIILVNCADIEYANAAYDVRKVKEVTTQLINVSRIVSVKTITRSIRKEHIPPMVILQIKQMSLDSDLGGSTIIYHDERGDARYLNVLETPMAIYKQIYSE